MKPTHKSQIPKTKKYNPDVDIVPIKATGFGLFTAEKGVHDAVLEVYSHSPSSAHDVCLGSFSIDKRFILNMIERFQHVIEELEIEEKKDIGEKTKEIK
jgi:hypothetical protein